MPKVFDHLTRNIYIFDVLGLLIFQNGGQDMEDAW